MSPDSVDVAIVGMACLFPGAPDLETYWRNIVSLVDSITDPPPGMPELDRFYEPGSTDTDRIYCRRGGFLGALAEFDPLAHGVMPAAAQGGEPDQWLALKVAREAMADAGLGDDFAERGRTAVILGKGNYPNRGNLGGVQHGPVIDQTLAVLRALHPEYSPDDLRRIKDELQRQLPPFDADAVPGLIPNITAGRIANRLDLMGPSFTVDAACASSLIAVDMAARDLRSGRCDLALVGGVHVATPLLMLLSFCRLGALSRRQAIRPFDRAADGTLLGEGVGMVVLKRREDAVRDGHRIYAVIKAVGTSSDGRALSVTAPRLEGEVLALRRAYDQAGFGPETIGLIEAHGTGTPVGDATEIEALREVFGARGDRPRRCAIGSVKSMIGHLMPAAGIAGLIKAALALHHRVLPPTLHVDDPSPALRLDETPFYPNSRARPWIHSDPQTPRRAGVNSFGFGGINAHAILEEHADGDEAAPPSRMPDRDSEVFLLAAGSQAELAGRCERLRDRLVGRPGAAFKDLAYSLNVPFPDGPERLAIVACTVVDLGEKLERARARLADPGCRKIHDARGIYYQAEPLGGPGRLAFLYPGEGSQYANMMSDLCMHFPEVRRAFDLADGVWAGLAEPDLPSDFLFPPTHLTGPETEARAGRLWQMEGAITAVLAANRAMSKLLERLGVVPDAILGHSTGEFAALHAAGMIRAEGAVELRRLSIELNQAQRAATVEDSIPSAVLVAVGADCSTVAELVAPVEGDLFIAMDNCSQQSVLVGQERSMDPAIDRLRGRGLIYERLPFDRPYHTPLFEPFAGPLRDFFARWITAPPEVRTYTCSTTRPFPDDLDAIRRLAVEQWVSRVDFTNTIESMYADGVRIFVEAGPKGMLCAFVDDILRGRPHLAVPADVTHRSGIAQLHHLLALLFAHGVPLRPDHLYDRRSPRTVDLDGEPAGRDDDRPAPDHPLKTGWPGFGFTEEMAARLRPRRGAPVAPAETVDPLASRPEDGSSGARAGVAIGGHPPHDPRPGPVATTPAAEPATRPRPSDSSQVLAAHFESMGRLVTAQTEVIQAYLAPQGAAPGPRPWQPPSGDGDHPATADPGPATGNDRAELPPPVAAVATGAEARESMAGLLIRLVSERTGYPAEMLDLDLNLEADLGIDSIKRVEILGSLQRELGSVEGVDLEVLSSRKTLREILDLLGTHAGPATLQGPPTSAAAASPRAGPVGPLLGEVIAIVPGEELTATRVFDLDEDRFLHSHTFGRRVSEFDPGLTGVPVVPLTATIELMAEAASALVPGRRVVALRGVRGYRWIALEGGRLALRVTARRQESPTGAEVHVQVFVADPPDPGKPPVASPVAESRVVLGDRWPDPPPAAALRLPDEGSSKWAPDQLYEEVTFHGPDFQGVASLDAISPAGARATLKVLPSGGLFRSDLRPAFLTDPVLLDQAGQVLGFWAMHRQADSVFFPFRVEELLLFGPPPAAGESLQCQLRIKQATVDLVRGDVDLVRGDGLVWARIVDWEDRRFEMPDRVQRMTLAPSRHRLARGWPLVRDLLPEGPEFDARRLGLGDFPAAFFTSSGAMWQRSLASATLGRAELDRWQGLTGPPSRRVDWLIGRIAAKDAVRALIERRSGVAPCPADLEIAADEQGRPFVRGPWADRLGAMPALSITHAAGVAVAVAGPAGCRLGVDVEPIGRATADLVVAFDEDEQELLATVGAGAEPNEWPTRLWCAKEAVAKALGTGMIGGPRSLVARAVDPRTGSVRIALAGALARWAEGRADLPRDLYATTAREGELVVAVSHFVLETKPEGPRDGQ